MLIFEIHFFNHQNHMCVGYRVFPGNLSYAQVSVEMRGFPSPSDTVRFSCNACINFRHSVLLCMHLWLKWHIVCLVKTAPVFSLARSVPEASYLSVSACTLLHHSVASDPDTTDCCQLRRSLRAALWLAVIGLCACKWLSDWLWSHCLTL